MRVKNNLPEGSTVTILLGVDEDEDVDGLRMRLGLGPRPGDPRLYGILGGGRLAERGTPAWRLTNNLSSMSYVVNL